MKKKGGGGRRKCWSLSPIWLCNPMDYIQPARLLCPWNSPGKNTGVGGHSLLQGIFPTQESNPGLLHCRQSLPTEPMSKSSSGEAGEGAQWTRERGQWQEQGLTLAGLREKIGRERLEKGSRGNFWNSFCCKEQKSWGKRWRKCVQKKGIFKDGRNNGML